MESGGTSRNIENYMRDGGVIIIRLYYNNNKTIITIMHQYNIKCVEVRK